MMPLRVAARTVGVGFLGYAGGAAAAGFGLMIAALAGVAMGPVAHSLLVVTLGAGGAVLAVRSKASGAKAEVSQSHPPVHGSAAFEAPDALRAALSAKNGLIVGREDAPGSVGRLLRYGGPSHLLTIAPTRSGKGVGAVIPNLLLARRAVVCVDPKGENARITAQARAAFGKVFVLDPFAATGLPSAQFNPLDALDPEADDAAEEAAAIADALVFDPPFQSGDAHWNEEARALIAGVILHVAASEPPPTRTLARVRAYLTGRADELLALSEDMAMSKAAGGLVARAANRQRSKSERERSSVLSTAQRHTHFLDSPRMAKVLGPSTFSFGTLRQETETVFLVLPPERLTTHARWLRLLIVQALSQLTRSAAPDAGSSALFLLDEFAALGRLDPLRNAFGLMAGYGVQIWAVLQDLHQLNSLYGAAAGTFLSNAGLIQVFNVADVETASWISRSLGAGTAAYETSGASTSRGVLAWLGAQSASQHQSLTRRELLTPDEVMRLPADRLLLLRPGARPAVGKKIRYFEDPEFSDALGPNTPPG